MRKPRKIPHAVYVPDDLWAKVKALARRRKLSASALMRQLLTDLFNVEDTVGPYVKDGQHTPEALEALRAAKQVERVLRELP